MKIPRVILILLVLFAIFLFLSVNKPSTSPLPSTPSPSHVALTSKSPNQNVLGVQTKTTNCLANGPLPDSACTPGAVFSSVTKEQICQSGYSSSVRNVPSVEKHQVYDEYDITHHTAGEYEVDHLISLELGGSNDIANLWPEIANPRPGFHEKDQVENYLHAQMCNGSITLQEAQYEISNNWMDVYKRIK